ncbi:phospholipase D2-like [Thraustotheca clavata]|uniref:Phospholipase n=1 Tax=Thraustotheca clavata TaxID=74557 RepID=A0A1V9ZCD8_9STRA|nr:phospholipase D2-like [Thraustotheca clavata]
MESPLLTANSVEERPEMRASEGVPLVPMSTATYATEPAADEKQNEKRKNAIHLDKPPTVKVVQVDRIKHWFYEFNLYTIEFNYDEFVWRIRTTTHKMFLLHLTLQRVLRFSQLFTFPPRLLGYGSVQLGASSIPILERYLDSLLAHDSVRNHGKMLEFLELGALRFSAEYGMSIAEGWVKMRYVPSREGTLHGRSSFIGFHFTKDNIIRVTEIFIVLFFCVAIPLLSFKLCVYFTHSGSVPEMDDGYVVLASIFSVIPGLYFIAICYQYLLRHRRWMVIKPTSIAFFKDMSDTQPSEVILFQPHVAVTRSTLLRNGLHWMMDGLHVITPGAIIEIDMKNLPQWTHLHDILVDTMDKCEFSHTSDQRFQSFAPVRPAVGNERMSMARHLVDGEEAFGNMVEHIRMANKQVFIAGWWITPNYPMVRGDDLVKLDSVLVDAAVRGVEVFILVYKEHRMFLPNDSLFTKNHLNTLHPRIHVLRHPDFVLIPQYWSHHEKIVVIDQQVAFVGGLDICLGRYDTHAHPLADTSKNPLFVGKDYSNPRLKDFADVINGDTDLIDRKKEPRMPWHDVHCRLEGLAAMDVARHFIHRWNFTLQKKYVAMFNRRRPKYRRPALLPMVHVPVQPTQFSEDEFAMEEGSEIRQREVTRWMPTNEKYAAACHCQIVRSMSPWSGGIKTEHSIQNAYIHIIENAKRFIYIENQFFVSGFENDPSVSNRILEALYQRIVKAHETEKTFRIVVVLPLMPAFEGAVTSKDSSSLRAVMHWQYTTICRGGNSLLERLRTKMPDPHKYISFFGLRQNAILGGTAVNEQIYIHSKLMIADDRTTIMGSANLNDRSMCGDRDSEIAVVLEDHELSSVTWDGEPFRVGKFAHSFRCRLFEEHVGTELADPISDESWDQLLSIAHKNSDIYERVFRCLPTDSLRSYYEMNVPEDHVYEDVTVIYENQRYGWGEGWKAASVHGGEVSSWTDESGAPFEDFQPDPSAWRVDKTVGACDREGWQYAFSFRNFLSNPDKIRSQPLWYRWVRRRRWILIAAAERKNYLMGRQESTTSDRDLRSIFRMQSSRIVLATGDDEDNPRPHKPKFHMRDIIDKVLPEVHELKQIRGHIVEFPLFFLCECDLRPMILPKNLFI